MKSLRFSPLFLCSLPLLLILCHENAYAAEQQRIPLRILSLSAAATHILMQLEQPPIAIDEYGLLAAGENPPPVLGRGSAVSFEKITELGINCVILWYYQNDAERLFRSRNLQVLQIAPIRLSNYAELLKTLGELTGKTKLASKLCEEFQKKKKTLPAVATGKAPTRVYFELYSEWKVAGEQSYLGDLLKAGGGQCPVAKTGLLSAETILEYAPEVIFYVQGAGFSEEIARRPGLSDTPAVRDGRIYPVERRFVTEGLALLEAIEFFQQKLNNRK
ncbi:MAG: ABC transporter substrate-binding protein [Lentisphaeria bacterium]